MLIPSCKRLNTLHKKEHVEIVPYKRNCSTPIGFIEIWYQRLQNLKLMEVHREAGDYNTGDYDLIGSYDLKPLRQIFPNDTNVNLPSDNDFLYQFF